MEQLKGLYFFLMSEGEYSDYGVNALYVSDKPITEEDWHNFCTAESEFREKVGKQTVTAAYSPYVPRMAKETRFLRRNVC